jgi:AraC family transcriptional activator FtrA
MLRRVAVIMLDDVAPFEVGVLAEVFGSDRTADGFPAYDFVTCSLDGGPVHSEAGFDIVPSHDLGALEDADLIAVPAYPIGTPITPKLSSALRRAVDRGAYVLSLCTGAFLLAGSGILDGRRCTTHWRHAALLAEMHPAVQVEPEVLYVVDGNVSAGTAAAIDLCLHLVRAEHGSSIATALARRMVVAPHRSGGQAQFIEAPIPAGGSDAASLEPLLTGLLTVLDEQHTVESLATRAHMSQRTFARRFRAETGATPHDWLTAQRLLLARQLLEETDLGIDAIATRCGFGNAATLRHHFTKRVGATPNAYRATFKTPA